MADRGHERIATLDIETTHFKPARGETVSIGVGVHDRGSASNEASYELYHRNSENDESDIIEEALGRFDELGADALVTYNGREFDLPFLNDRLQLLGIDPINLKIDSPETHVDLYENRKRDAPRHKKWPSLEECLASYGFDEPVTIWEGAPVTNARFGKELGPSYLESVVNGEAARNESLTEVIGHYLTTDLEANIALYYADIGERFEPAYLGTPGEF